MKFRELTGRVVVLNADDVDTDQIIPARFLKVTDKKGLGDVLFADWRQQPGFVLDKPESKGAQVLVAGRNFGCGSSREHAPWALTGWGLRAIVARSFADIFKGNALKNGLLPVEVDDATHGALLAATRWDPRLEVSIDLAERTLTWPGGPTVKFPVDPFAQKCLLNGLDELQYLLSKEEQIRAYEARR